MFEYDGGVVESQGDGGNSLDSGDKMVNERLLVNVKNRRREGISVIEDLDDSHSVCQREDVQHVEKYGLGCADTCTNDNNLDVGDDFDGITRGGDTKSLEEGRLSGLHTSVSSGNSHVLGCECSSMSWGCDLVGGDEVTELFEVAGREDESMFPLIWGGDGLEGRANHGVLSH